MAYGRIAGIGKGTAPNGTMANKTAIHTMDNILIICDDIYNCTCASNDVLFKFPNSFPKPDRAKWLGCFIGTQWSRLLFNTSGEIRATSALSNATVFLSGIYINLNNIYYNDTIGNNDESTMTSPIMWK